MLTNTNTCFTPSNFSLKVNESEKECMKRYERCIFHDMKLGIDYLKEFTDKVNSLHPDVYFKIKSLI